MVAGAFSSIKGIRPLMEWGKAPCPEKQRTKGKVLTKKNADTVWTYVIKKEIIGVR
jgi:hypothetical protein